MRARRALALASLAGLAVVFVLAHRGDTVEITTEYEPPVRRVFGPLRLLEPVLDEHCAEISDPRARMTEPPSEEEAERNRMDQLPVGVVGGGLVCEDRETGRLVQIGFHMHPSRPDTAMVAIMGCEPRRDGRTDSALLALAAKYAEPFLTPSEYEALRDIADEYSPKWKLPRAYVVGRFSIYISERLGWTLYPDPRLDGTYPERPWPDRPEERYR